MTLRAVHLVAVGLAALLLPRSACASPAPEEVELVLSAGTPLRVALDQRVKVKHVGQAVTATVVEPVYAFDRVVIPAGARVLGHLEKLEGPSKGTRLRALLRGDLTPPRRVVLDFNTLVLPEGDAYPLAAVVTDGTENVVLQVAGANKKTGIVAQAREEIASRANQVMSAVKKPGKIQRLKDWARDKVLGGLPVHPQFLKRDTVFNVTLAQPVSFGEALASEAAAPDAAPAPGSILTARLVTPLDSATTPRWTAIEAVLTQPVFTADHQLILPEGAKLTGEVTVARPARHFHRNGQLRVLFEGVEATNGASAPLLASLYSIQAGESERLKVDEEGGTTASNSGGRFAAPVLASLALASSFRRDVDVDADAPGGIRDGAGRGSSVGGFFGLGFLGAGLARTSRPLGIGLAIVGVARTAYGSIFGRGRDVKFPQDTPIQVRLAPGPDVPPSPTPDASPSPNP